MAKKISLIVIIIIATAVSIFCLLRFKNRLFAGNGETIVSEPEPAHSLVPEAPTPTYQDLPNLTTMPFWTEKVPVLMYHYIEKPGLKTFMPGLYLDPAIFENQVQVIKNDKYNSIFVSELAGSLRTQAALPAKSVALTFDDGYQDFYTNVWPILKKYQIKATLYIIINKLDQPGYLTRKELKEIAGDGLIEIGSHTFNHPDLRNLKLKDAEFEIKNSRQVLEQLSGQPILTFAYPFGYYRQEYLAIASSTGYLAAATITPGVSHSNQERFILKRVRPGDRQGENFRKWLADWFQAAY